MDYLKHINLNYWTPKKFIDNHTHIRYCEALIRPDGKIAYVQTSHQNCLIKEYCDKQNIAYTDVVDSISAMFWEETLINGAGVILVWYGFCKTPEEITEEQKYTLALLSQNAPKVISKDFEIIKVCRESG